jgi:hypothetical protein
MRTVKNIAFAVSLFLLGCAHKKDHGDRAYYEEQVSLRLQALMTDSTNRELPAVHEEIERIILVSKDQENPAAAVNLARTLFDSLCQTYGLQRSDFPDIEAGMAPEETELQLRENELAFFDRLVMKKNPGGGKMFTAH